MSELLNSMTSLEIIFWICASVSTLLFMLRIIMMFAGGFADIGDGDLDVDISADTDAAGDLSDTDVAFHFFSINTITAFFMMFGWTGLACYKQFSLNAVYSISIGIGIGLFCMYVTGYLFKLSSKLISKGSVFCVDTVIGSRANVYQMIPGEGKGRIHVNIEGGLTRELNAVSEDNVEIESFQTVEITGVVDKDTVKVKAVSK